MVIALAFAPGVGAARASILPQPVPLEIAPAADQSLGIDGVSVHAPLPVPPAGWRESAPQTKSQAILRRAAILCPPPPVAVPTPGASSSSSPAPAPTMPKSTAPPPVVVPTSGAAPGTLAPPVVASIVTPPSDVSATVSSHPRAARSSSSPASNAAAAAAEARAAAAGVPGFAPSSRVATRTPRSAGCAGGNKAPASHVPVPTATSDSAGGAVERNSRGRPASPRSWLGGEASGKSGTQTDIVFGSSGGVGRSSSFLDPDEEADLADALRMSLETFRQSPQAAERPTEVPNVGRRSGTSSSANAQMKARAKELFAAYRAQGMAPNEAAAKANQEAKRGFDSIR